MSTYTFESNMYIGPTFTNDVPDNVVKNEPMFFNSSLTYAMQQGGPITKDFISKFCLSNPRIDMRKYVFDSRVHMLMKGWYPCIPGFHHDDVPRGANGQPNYDTPEYESMHCFGLVNGDIAPTEFALGKADFVLPEGIVYKKWHNDVEDYIADGVLKRFSAPSDKLIYFDNRTFHQGVKAVKDGWRWFGRISWNTDRSNTVTNEIRRQVQVYLEFPMEGW